MASNKWGTAEVFVVTRDSPKVRVCSPPFLCSQRRKPGITRIVWQKMLQQDIKNSRRCVCLETLRSTAKSSVTVSGRLVDIQTIRLLDSLQNYHHNKLFDMVNRVSRSIKFSWAVIHLTRLSVLKSLSSFVTVKASRKCIEVQQMYSITTAHRSHQVQHKISAVE